MALTRDHWRYLTELHENGVESLGPELSRGKNILLLNSVLDWLTAPDTPPLGQGKSLIFHAPRFVLMSAVEQRPRTDIVV